MLEMQRMCLYSSPNSNNTIHVIVLNIVWVSSHAFCPFLKGKSVSVVPHWLLLYFQGQKIQAKLSKLDQDTMKEATRWPLVLMNKRWQKHSLFTMCCVEIRSWHTPKMCNGQWIWHMGFVRFFWKFMFSLI